ncbi:MAG: potassium transporter Kup [Solirubrobacterales bacterium]|nr:potassium transporter Kup [Solirubrobacterales bacterium]
MEAEGKRGKAKAAMVVGALGIVFGDIGTSPIYTIQTAFNPDDPHPVQSSIESVYGIVSLIFWAVTIIVTIKYVLLVLRADNDGEGGIMALISQVREIGDGVSARTKFLLGGLGVFGAALFFGDSTITPAISVLSAVEGIEVIEPSLESLVVPITATIIVVLFASQRLGTAVVARVFGPIMTVWFLTIGILGIRGIAMHPGVLKALSPSYALDFLFSGGTTGFFSLAAVVLAITGAEALYADLGHFGRSAISRAWLLLVFPACILSYLGQGGLILDDPSAISEPFFKLVPDDGLIPLVVLATTATVIASQAVISGAFSIAHQAAQLGYLPRLRVIHTSEDEIGQVYVPFMNWLLLGAVLTLVFTFQTSTKLAAAYGLAVTGTLIITTILFFVLVRHRWHKPFWLAAPGASGFLVVELAFLGANLTKIPHGGWLPLTIGVVGFTVMVTWFRGRALVTEERLRVEGLLPEFITELRAEEPPIARVPGTAVFMNRGRVTAPLSMRANVDRLHSLHEHVVVLSLETMPVPRIPDSERLEIDELGHKDDGITFVRAKHGYFEQYDVPALIRLTAEAGVKCPLEAEEASYFLSKIELRVSDRPGMSVWRKHLFLATATIAAEPADYFRLPREQTVFLGSQIEF